jgi:hypothetical protein
MSPAASRAAVFVLAAILASAMAFDLWRMPVQVSDALGEILAAQASPSVAQSFRNAAGATSYLRPLRIAQIKALFDLSRGNYRLAYRGFHVLLLVSLVLLFARALRVESSLDAAAAAFALTVLIGLHTFLGFVREAFPINHFLEIAVLTLVALNLTLSRGGIWADALAAMTFACAALTLESGVLVWVVIAAAWVCGCRGVSTRGVVVMTAMLGGYFLLRFWYLHTGVPGLTERATGFLLERLEPSEIQQRFGDAPLIFYAYNVGASLLSVLFAEPREGVFTAVREWMRSDVQPRVYLAVLSSASLTLLMVWAALRWWRQPARLGRPERVALIGAVVLLANAALSFAYTKDDIMALGGVFYALIAYAAMRTVLERARTLGPVTTVVVSAAVLVVASAWAMRASGVHHVTNEHAFRTRNDWAELPMAWQREGRWPTTPEPLAVIERLRADALDAPVPNPQLAPEWRSRWYGD